MEATDGAAKGMAGRTAAELGRDEDGGTTPGAGAAAIEERAAGTVAPAAGPEADAAAPEADGFAADPDDLEAMGDEIARLSAHVQAATRRYRELVAELDRLRGAGDSEGSDRRFT